MNKTQKGITLIALIITVIVLLILAGTAISIAINGGDIFGKAQTAREEWNAAVAKEETELQNAIDLFNSITTENNDSYSITYNANGGSGTMNATTAANPIVANNGFTAPNDATFVGWNTSADRTGTSYAAGTALTANTTLYAQWDWTGYSIGQEVRIGNEYFYVFDPRYNTSGNITLFSKYCLNQEGTEQAASSTGCKFSDTNYWGNDYTTYYDSDSDGWDPSPKTEGSVWTKERLNLNTISGYATGDAMDKAKKYAQIISNDNTNNTGRLLTYEEVNTLKTDYTSMISATEPTRYWLGSAPNTTDSNNVGTLSAWVFFVTDSSGALSSWACNSQDFGHKWPAGVRPIITVPKSIVSII